MAPRQKDLVSNEHTHPKDGEASSVADEISEFQESHNKEFQHHRLYKEMWNRFIWHGGSNYDAWFNAVSGQMGFGLGVFFHLLYALIGIWTCYLLACLYLEYRTRKEKQGAVFKMHVIQYHEVMGDLVGAWLRKVCLFFNITTMGAVAVVQIIACASNAYYLNSSINKQRWAIIFGAISTLTVMLPSFHNFRIWSIIGVISTTYTAWFMFIAALVHGQIPNVKHSGRQGLPKFFAGTTTILFAFGGHAITIEIMHAMWKPRNYKFVYVATVLFVLSITLPHSLAVYWAFGDELLKESNSLAVFPKSAFRDIGLVFMIMHQAIAFGLYILPLNFMWEKVLRVHRARYLVRVVARLPVAFLLWFLALLIPFFGPLNSMIGALIMSFSVFIIPCVAYLIVFRERAAREEAAEKPARWMPSWRGIVALNSLIITTIFVLGFCFGSWASITNLAKQVSSFGLFDKCYECAP